MQYPDIFAAVKDWLQVVVPHLVLTGCIKVMKTALSSGHLVVALAFKRCSSQHLDHGEYANLRYNTNFSAGHGKKWDITPQVQGNPLAALGC